MDLGILPAGGMMMVGSRTFVPVARGTIQGVSWEPDPARKP